MSELIKFTQKLLQIPSVTPHDGGAIEFLERKLKELGFETYIEVFADDVDSIPNLYASIGKGERNLCFAGHTDVVPVGDENAWTSPPFGAEIKDGYLIARGVTDMKAAICCFIFAAEKHLKSGEELDGKISLLITGDEEARSVNGTIKMLKWLDEQKIKLSHCIVGEPTNPNVLGEMIKIGRRGTVTFDLTVYGIQGHVAYPKDADNPVTKLIKTLNELKQTELDKGNEDFQASNLEITNIDIGNKATNVIPAKAKATFNIRYNNLQTHEKLTAWVHETCKKHCSDKYELKYEGLNEAFICNDLDLANLLTNAVEKVLDTTPVRSTSGGTSDARFIKNYCPTIEFGLISNTAHKVDEKVLVNDIEKLSEIYYHFINNYFKK